MKFIGKLRLGIQKEPSDILYFGAMPTQVSRIETTFLFQVCICVCVYQIYISCNLLMPALHYNDIIVESLESKYV